MPEFDFPYTRKLKDILTDTEPCQNLYNSIVEVKFNGTVPKFDFPYTRKLKDILTEPCQNLTFNMYTTV